MQSKSMSATLEWWQRRLLDDEVVDDLDYRAIMTEMHAKMTTRTTDADIWMVREFARYLAKMTRFRL